MNQFYTSPEHVTEKQLTITGQEAAHAVKSLRLHDGDEIWVTDGAGSRFRCIITDASPSRVVCDIEERAVHEPASPAIYVAIGVLKKRDRMEFAIEKGTEIGAAGFLFFRGDHSEKPSLNLRRAEATALSAMKQSLRLHLPVVESFKSLDALLKTQHAARFYTAHQDATESFEEVIGEEIQNVLPDKRIVVVGPEGGLSDREVTLLKQADSHFVGLGSHRLRAETAAIVAADRCLQALRR